MNHLRTLLMAASCLALMIFASGCEKKEITQNATPKETPLRVTSTRFIPNTLSVQEHDNTTKIKLLVNYKDCDDPAQYGIKLKSSDDSKITIDEHGVINALEPGDAKIIAFYQDEERICTDTLKVKINIDYPITLSGYLREWDDDKDGFISLEEAAKIKSIPGDGPIPRLNGNINFYRIPNLNSLTTGYKGGTLDFSSNSLMQNVIIFGSYSNDDDEADELINIIFNPDCSLRYIFIDNDPLIQNTTSQKVVLSNYENCPEMYQFSILGECPMDVIDISKSKKLYNLQLQHYTGILYLSSVSYEWYKKYNNDPSTENQSKNYCRVNPEATVIAKD